MKNKIKSLGVFAITLLCIPFIGISSAQAVTLMSTFYVIKDFYEVNWQRDYWDTGENSIDGNAGSVVYSKRADSMTVTYTGVYETGVKNNIMWGVTGQIEPNKRDFSSGEFFANEVKNELASDAKYQLIVSHSEEDKGNLYPQEQKKYYLLAKNGTVIEGKVKSAFFTLPANFEGMLLIPMDTYPDILIKTNIMRFSFGFPRGESGKITFGRVGYVDNDALLNGGEITIQDETKYFDLPERIVLQKAPLRPITEPETADENRTK